MTAFLDTSKVIVGASGSGKTVTAKDEVQQLLEQRRHVAVIDPTGVWWGMRSNAAGDGPGYDLPIFGGEHGDVPIGRADGAAIARIIIGQRVSAIVDLSLIDNSRDWRRFMADFVAELRKKPKANFHFVVDEADEFAAEKPVDDIGFALRENMVWIAKRGRVRGFVSTFITQRTAEIAKAVISQAQTIVAHQLTAPSDKKAIDDYLKDHGEPAVRRNVMASLAGLAIGERWIYSPRLHILERDVTPALTTFDSSRTPPPGEQLVEPRTLAQLDVSAIRAALAPARPEASVADDLNKEFLGGASVVHMLTDRDQHIAALEARVVELEGENAALDSECDRWVVGVGAIEALVHRVQRDTPLGIAVLGDDEDPDLHSGNATSGAARHLELVSNSASAITLDGAAPAAEGASPGEAVLEFPSSSGGAPENTPRKVRTAESKGAGITIAPSRLNRTALDMAALLLAASPDGFTWDDGLLLIGRRPNSGDSRLARKGLLEHKLMRISGAECFAGAGLIDQAEIPVGYWPDAQDLTDLWADKLRGPGGEILRDLFSNGPASNAEVAARLGKSPTSGWWRQGIRDLRRSNIVTERDGKLELHPFFSKGEA